MSAFDAFALEKLRESAAAGVRPGDEERLLRVSEQPTPWAILYIHGFSASRAEGEAVVELLSQELGANAWMLRLPGHGLNDPHALGLARPPDYVEVCEQALLRMSQLGERLLLMGCSTGGLLATALAARHPERVQGLVLVSPFYAYASLSALPIRLGARRLVRALLGELRDASWPSEQDPEGRKGPDYDQHWTLRYPWEAVFQLESLRRELARPSVWERVQAPSLLLYYERDASHRDGTASVKAMRRALSRFRTHPLSRAAAIADGNHVLLSAHVRTDKAAVLQALRRFMAELC